jgi:outer membrane protein insertion porin family
LGLLRAWDHRSWTALACALLPWLLVAPAWPQTVGPISSTPSPGTTGPQTGQQQVTTPAGARAPGYAASQTLSAERPPTSSTTAATPSLRAWEGLTVEAVEFRGVDRTRLEPLPNLLPLQPNRALAGDAVRQSLRRLYATGLYRDIQVEGRRQGNGVVVIFTGKAAYFFGRVSVDGVKNDRLSSQLQRATRLQLGTTYTESKMTRADEQLAETLEENGFYTGKVAKSTTLDAANAQINVQYRIDPGKQARVGDVDVAGKAGMTEEQFRKKGKLKLNSKVNRDTVSRALDRLRRNYQKQQRLEANVQMKSKNFTPADDHLNYNFQSEQGPVVAIRVNGVKLGKGKIRTLVPVYEEGTVDEDLLNEGDRRLRDYYQRAGYFEVRVTHTHTQSAAATLIVFEVTLGQRREVTGVTLTGNHYFSNAIILPRLSVRKKDLFMRHGSYSQALVQSDADAITALYQSNGFSKVTVTPQVNQHAGGGKSPGLSVRYAIDQGPQNKFGKYVVTGNEEISSQTMAGLLTLQSGQPYSAANILADRDAILGYYFSHGFDHATILLRQKAEKANPELIDVTMQITEGEQIFVNKVLISGLHYTRPSTIDSHILLQSGQPLDQSALFETQRQLYDLTLFNEVNTAVQNPGGDELRKNVLVQITEAKRWDVTYGTGFQVQTGNPSTSCPSAASLIALGLNPANYTTNCGPNGNTGASALVLFDISRINLLGRNQSVTLRTRYGSLEKQATLIYSVPHLLGNPKFDFSLSGGYINAQDVTTYAASRLEGTIRVTHRPNRPNTLLYDFTYRRVKVDPNSVQVSPDEIPLIAEPVRVGGPALTWIRDTRRPTPLDATAGTYNSVQEFVTDSIFKSEANFNRLDLTNSSYYTVSRKKYVLARSTRFGYERAYGEGKYEYIPLPERLYAGGAQSLRAYPINAAGPRDSLTGFPIGGAGAFVNSTEIRFPNPTLPYFGNTLGFVLFHDMGNVFNKSSDIWPSFLRTRQPDSSTCKDLSLADQSAVTRSSSTNTTGTCSFNYFTHDVGIGVRYHTPIGPLRIDFSYTLNPPIYPVIITYGTNSNGSPILPYVGQAGHFNFFFSIGQAF